MTGESCIYLSTKRRYSWLGRFVKQLSTAGEYIKFQIHIPPPPHSCFIYFYFFANEIHYNEGVHAAGEKLTALFCNIVKELIFLQQG